MYRIIVKFRNKTSTQGDRIREDVLYEMIGSDNITKPTRADDTTIILDWINPRKPELGTGFNRRFKEKYVAKSCHALAGTLEKEAEIFFINVQPTVASYREFMGRPMALAVSFLSGFLLATTLGLLFRLSTM